MAVAVVGGLAFAAYRFLEPDPQVAPVRAGEPAVAAAPTVAPVGSQTVVLTHIAAGQAVAVLNALADLSYESGDRPGGRHLAKLRISASPENSVLLTGPADAIAEVAGLLDRLDVPSSDLQPLTFDGGRLVPVRGQSASQLRQDLRGLRVSAWSVPLGTLDLVVLWGEPQAVAQAAESVALLNNRLTEPGIDPERRADAGGIAR